MNNVTKLPVYRANPHANALADEIYDLLKKYEPELTLATIVGVLEMVKADVLDAMKN